MLSWGQRLNISTINCDLKPEGPNLSSTHNRRPHKTEKLCDVNLSCSVMFCMKKNKCKKEWHVVTRPLNVSLVTGASNKRETSNSKEDSNREGTGKRRVAKKLMGRKQQERHQHQVQQKQVRQHQHMDATLNEQQ
jgi:hypothetical protein